MVYFFWPVNLRENKELICFLTIFKKNKRKKGKSVSNNEIKTASNKCITKINLLFYPIPK